MANAEKAIRCGMIRRPSREEASRIIANQAKNPDRKVVGIWKKEGKTIARATVMPADYPGDIKALAQSFAGVDLLIISNKI